MGDGWSIAWRVLDAQFWGVPQRRRRIALVADFGGQSAPEILFVSKGVSGNTEPSQSKRKDTASDASRGTGADDCYCYDIGEARLRTPSEYKDVSPTLSARCGTGGNNTPAVITFEPGIASREGGHIYEGVSGTLRANAGDNQMDTAYTMQDREGCKGGGKGALVQKDRSASLRTVNSQYLFQPVVYENHSQDSRYKELGDVCETVSAKYGRGGNNQPLVLALDRDSYQDKVGALCARDYKGVGSQYVDEGKLICAVDCRNGTEDAVNGALQSNMAHSLNGNNIVRTRYIVRRLTPMECERLQGYPDGWTDIGEWIDSNGKKHQTSDAARYKALGNSIALPPWKWVLKRICACYERDATMASLFDGIGGFPYLWEQLNGKGTCLWASEIEEFPMAVTKLRFPEE
jgi:DNA (cytosine-5)-methyltransferase 1